MTSGEKPVIDVVTVAPDALSPAELQRMEADLDAGERVRAQRFVFEEDRRAFVAAHAVLRRTLSALVDPQRAPSRWRFASRAGGKPDCTDCRVEISLSHTRGLAACAVSSTAAVGVDVERIVARPIRDVFGFAFAAAEARWLDGHDRAQAGVAFTRLWTLKEACVKASGDGLQALQSFTLGFEPPRVLAGTPGGIAADRWSFREWQIADSHRLALAWAGDADASASPAVRFRDATPR